MRYPSTLLSLFLAGFLLACTTADPERRHQLHQSVRPAPGPTLVQTPPSYPGTTYTPTGTGAPVLSQPGQQGTPAQRSPNKRPLPPTKEPGLWAADNAVKASSDLPAIPLILEVELPFPPGASTDEDKRYTRLCSVGMNLILQDVAHLIQLDVMTLSLDVRRCMAARLYEHCASDFRAKLGDSIKNGKTRILDGDQLSSLLAIVKSTDNTAKKFVNKACTGVPRSQEVEEKLTYMMVVWDKVQSAK